MAQIQNLDMRSILIQKYSNLFSNNSKPSEFVPIFYQIYQISQLLVDLFAKNMKGWSHKNIIIYFFFASLTFQEKNYLQPFSGVATRTQI